MKNRLIEEIMETNVEKVFKTGTLNYIIQSMEKKKCTHILVVDEKELVLGIISKNDLFGEMKKILSATNSSRYTVLEMNSIRATDVMTESVVYLNPKDKVEKAFKLFLKNNFHALPVLEGNKIKGIVTHFDLLKFYNEN